MDHVKSRRWFGKEQVFKYSSIQVFKYLVQWMGDFKDTYEPQAYLSDAAREFAYLLSPHTSFSHPPC